ncbi:MAG: heavy metal-associated domain-containing protein [Eubacteriales bacterium]
MTILQVPGIHCPVCVGRIDKALTAAGIEHTIDLEAKTVTVNSAQVATVIEELDDLGFEVAQ